MGDDKLWQLAPISTFALGPTRLLALNRHDLDVFELDGIAAAVLGRCRGVRPLQEHIAQAWTAGLSQSPTAITDAIDVLVSLGLLRPLADSTGRTTRTIAIPSPAPLNVAAIVTADRPHALSRALKALEHDRNAPLEIFVIDGSRSLQAETRAIVNTARATYIGQTEAAALRERLAAVGVPCAVLSAALTPGSIGSNRNLATLLTAGRRLLMQDDDVVGKVWALTDASEDVVVGGHLDLRHWHFFETRAEALASVRAVDADLLAVHAGVLGRTLADLTARRERTRFDQACVHMVAALGDPSGRTVRVTFAGLAGDAARYCSHGLLFDAGPVRQRLWEDVARFATATTSREVAVVAPATIVTHDAACVGYCFGIDNTALVPPFMPVGRNEDGVWGATLAFADTQAIFAHLPWGVHHESDRPAGYDSSMPSAREARLSDALLFAINRMARAGFAAAPADRLRHLGRMLLDAGRLPATEFRTWLAEAKLAVMAGKVAEAVAAAADPACPPHWREAVDEYQRTFRKAVMRPEYFLPIEFRDSATLDAGVARAQRCVGEFGELLTWWPVMWNAAWDLHEERTALVGQRAPE